MTELLNSEEVVELLRITNTTLYTLINKQGLPAFKVGREWRFRREALEEWLQRKETEKKEN